MLFSYVQLEEVKFGIIRRRFCQEGYLSAEISA
jgi:hypothetical protein